MKGTYHIVVQNNRIKFEFDIKRNITVVKGDSATGKTTLISMIDTFDRLGEESGINVVCPRRCLTINNANWEAVISSVSECIIFVDEENTVIKTHEFARKIQDTDNYYVLVTRDYLPNLPYSVEEIYGIHVSGKYADLRQTYNSFYHIYNLDAVMRHQSVPRIIVEDSNSGHEFFASAARADDSNVISANGKSKIRKLLESSEGQETLVIADGAAFGSEMDDVYLYMQRHAEVSAYLPESFEWIILSSGLIDGVRIEKMLEHPEEYIESQEHFSWERYFTHLLVQETKDTYMKYSKSKLNPAYLQSRMKGRIIGVLPEEIRSLFDTESETNE